MFKKTTLAAWITAVLLVPRPTLGQVTTTAVIQPPAVVAVDPCASTSLPYSAEWGLIYSTALMEREQAKGVLSELEAQLRSETATRSADVELQYVLAATIGSRAELEGGRAQMSAAKAAHRQAMVVLELEPEHPGAKHIVGRLHREVLTLGRIKRFLAIRLFGGGELAGASWESAQALLESAVLGDPCSTDHHFELAQLYLARGEVDQARARLRHITRLAVRSPRDEVLNARAVSMLRELSQGE